MRARIIINRKEDKKGSKNICLVNYCYVIIIIIYNIFVVVLFSDLFVTKRCNKCIMSKVDNLEGGIK